MTTTLDTPEGNECMAFLVEPNGDYLPIDLNVRTPLELFGQRPYHDRWTKEGYDYRPFPPAECHPSYPKARHGDLVLNRSKLFHDPDQHDGPGPRTCIEAWTQTCGEKAQDDNPVARAIVLGLPCFAPIAFTKCKGRMVFVRWGGESLTQADMDKVLGLARAVKMRKSSEKIPP